MTPYLIQLLLFISYSIFFILLNKKEDKSNISLWERLYVLISIIQFTLFSGLRAASVGTDTQMYVNNYINNTSIDNNVYTYNFLRTITWRISKGNYHIFLMVIAFITTYCIIYGIYRLCIIFKVHNKIKFIFLSIANYLLYNFYLATFNTARQFLAVAICFLAVTYLIEHKYIKYSILEILAIGVHNTAIFTIVLLLVILLKKNYKNLVLIMCIAVLANYFAIPLIQLLTHYSNHYQLYTATNISSMTSNGGMLLIGMLFLIINIVGLIYLKKLRKKSNFLNCVYIAILGGAMYIIGMKSQMFLRIALYASIFNIVSMPIASLAYERKNVFLYRNVKLEWIPDFLILFIGIGIYIYMLQNNFGDIVPYSLS